MILYYRDEYGDFHEYGEMKEGIWMTKKEIDGTYSYHLHKEEIPRALEFASLVPCLRDLTIDLNKYLVSKMKPNVPEDFNIKIADIIDLLNKVVNRVGKRKKQETLKEV